MRLCDTDIERHLDEGKIVIEPRPGVERISGVSVDVLLGNEFRVFRDHTAPYIDLSGPSSEMADAIDRVMSDEIHIPDGEAFYLHPGQLALAVTYESVTSACRYRRLAGWPLFIGAPGFDGARDGAPDRSGLVRSHRAGVLQRRQTAAGTASEDEDRRLELRDALRRRGPSLQQAGKCQVQEPAGRRCQSYQSGLITGNTATIQGSTRCSLFASGIKRIWG